MLRACPHLIHSPCSLLSVPLLAQTYSATYTHLCCLNKHTHSHTLPSYLFSSVMSSTVHGIPRVISDSELTTGFTKASPVVIPDKMPMTTLNLDLDGLMNKTDRYCCNNSMNMIVRYRGSVWMTQMCSRNYYDPLKVHITNTLSSNQKAGQNK